MPNKSFKKVMNSEYIYDNPDYIRVLNSDLYHNKKVSKKEREQYLASLSKEDLAKVRNTAYVQGHTDLTKDATKQMLRNKGYSGRQLTGKTKTALANLRYGKLDELRHERVLAERQGALVTKAEKIAKKYGIKFSKEDIKLYGLPNPKVLNQSLDKFIKDAKRANNRKPSKPIGQKGRTGEKYRQPDDVVEANAIAEYEKIQKAGRDITQNKVKNALTKRINDFLFAESGRGGYFKYGDRELNDIIKEYLKELTPAQTQELERVLLSDKFMKEYESETDEQMESIDLDEDSDAFGKTSAVTRQIQTIEMLTKMTGKSITFSQGRKVVHELTPEEQQAMKHIPTFKDYIN